MQSILWLGISSYFCHLIKVSQLEKFAKLMSCNSDFADSIKTLFHNKNEGVTLWNVLPNLAG